MSGLTPESRRDFAVVVPAFNEVEMIPQLIRELKDTFQAMDLHGEVILVDDGSDDGTADLAREVGAGWAPLRVLQHHRNMGKTEAITTAAAATDKSWLVIFDADLQHLPAEIPRFLEKLQEGYDMVTGRKVGQYDKRMVSSIYNRLGRWIFRVPVSDMNSMKAFRRDLLEEVRLRHDWHRFLVVLAHHRGYSIAEVDVPLYPRRAGTSKYGGPFRIVLGVLDLVAVWFLLLFSRKPLVLFGVSGAALVALGLLIGLGAVYVRWIHGVGFRPILYLVILLETVGFLLLGFGLVAEMIAQLREEVDDLRRRTRD